MSIYQWGSSGSISISGPIDTELPAAQTLADNMANPSAPAVGAFLMGWDGVAWDRVVKGQGNMAASLSVAIASDQSVLRIQGEQNHDSPAGNIPVLLAGYGSAVVPTAVSADGDLTRLWTDRNGRLAVYDGGIQLSVDDDGGSITVDSPQFPASLVGGRLDSNVGAWLGSTSPSVGQKAMASSLPVVIASDQSAVNAQVTPSGGSTWNVVQSSASALNAEVQGDAAHGASVSGNPVLLGLEARTTNATAVSNGQAVRAMADDMGRQIVVANGVRDLVTQNHVILNTGSETTILTGIASTFLDITRLIVSNTSATAVRVEIRDTAGGGATRLSLMLAANGGGAVIPFDPPLKQTTAGASWVAQLFPSVTDVRIFAQAVQNV